MSEKSRRWAAASATPWNGMPRIKIDPSQRLAALSHRSGSALRRKSFDGDIEFMSSHHRDACPRCGGSASRNGKDEAAPQRYRRGACARTSTPATGIIFEGRKLPPSAWPGLFAQIFSYANISLMTGEDRRSATTIPYWMGKSFAVLDGARDDVMLAGDVWIDETCLPESKGELV